MSRLILYFTFLICLGPVYGQVNSSLRMVDSLKTEIDLLLHPEKKIARSTLERSLLLNFPQSPVGDGKWVYYQESGKIQKIEKPAVSKLIPEYAFYRVSLTNFLGYHINSSTNLILFDSVKTKIIHVVPMWYGDISRAFLKLFIGKQFSDSTSLLEFTIELESLMNIGSTGMFENTRYSYDKVTFDLTYQGANKKEVWRHIEMFITDNRITGFRSTNPQMNESIIVQ
jgi:hypothetical protein